MIRGFAGINYTYLDIYLRTRLLENYETYYKHAIQFKSSKTGFLDDVLLEYPLVCVFTNVPLNTSFQLVNTIYCTYLMTKAPVSPQLEQAANLLPILEDVSNYKKSHENVAMMEDKSQTFSLLDGDTSVYDDDFKYDPIFSQHLGVYIGRFFSQSAGRVKISNMWKSCQSSSFDRMANSNGLRGWRKGNFFNKKGFEVVYEFLNDRQDVKMTDLVNQYLEADLKTAVTDMNQDKYTFWKHYMDCEEKKEDILDRATFHIVDKIQRGGGREIFVMDIKTKAVQYPVERFFAKLCKIVPNEMISVPSNKRSNVVHSMFFEKKQGSWVRQILKWVLDCGRWAPHSVFQKYVHFVHGMSHVLPKSFLAQFYFLSEKMMSKRYLVRPSIHKVVSGNLAYSEHMQHMKIKNFPDDYFEIDVPFSFVMGIFNYLSSLMHAANQLYASELIRDWHLKENMGLVSLSMNAHSDDSAGESQHEMLESIPTTLGMYDWLLKGANHMLSVKKSQVNTNVYFEFLSILYLKRQMLPVSPKFLSSMPFKPTDNGYASDVMISVSQSIEAFSQGCSQSESYLLMKLSEKFIQDVYTLRVPTELSPQLMGGVDSFPIEYMLGGPLTDLWKDTKYNLSNFKKTIHLMRKLNLLDPSDRIPTVQWDMKAKLPARHTFKLDDEGLPDQFLNSWFMENCKSDSPILNVIWYSKKLNDRKYMASLINEPDSRRYSRIFGSAANRYMMRIDGTRLAVSEIFSALTFLDELEEVEEDVVEMTTVVELLTGELSNFHDAISYNAFDNKNYTTFRRTVKPVKLTASFSNLGSIGDISANEYIVYKFEPEMYKFFGKSKDIAKSVRYMDNVLSSYIPADCMTPDLVKPMINRITGRDNKVYNFINTVTSDIRNLMDHENYLKLFCESLRNNKKLMTDYKRAVAMDSNNSYKRRGIPKEVKDLINVENAIMFFNFWKVSNLDIFNFDLSEYSTQLKRSIPIDWLPYVYHEYNSSLCLGENFYWSIWLKEQRKWSREWIGEGTLIFNVPECFMKVTMMNEAVKGIEISTSDFIEFGQMSSWFLGGIFDKELRAKAQMFAPEVIPDDKVVLGYSHSRKTWGIGFSYSFDLVFDCVSCEGVLIDPILSQKALWTNDESGKSIVILEDGKKMKTKKILDNEFDKFTDIGNFLSPEKMGKLKDKNLQKMCQDCALIQGKNVRYDLKTLTDNISRTKIYDICFNFSQANNVASEVVNNSLLDAFIEEKHRNKSFGFPSEQDIVALSSNPWRASMPSAVQEYAYKLGSAALTEDELEYAYTIISNNEGSDIDMLLADLRMLYGETSAVQNLIAYLVKDTRIFKMTFLLGPGTRICSIHEDLFNFCSGLLDQKSVQIPLLNLRKREVEKTFKKKIEVSEVFKIMYTKAVLDCMFMSNKPDHRGSKTTDMVIGVIKEVFQHIDQHDVARFQFKTDMLRTTDFFSDIDSREKWFSDIFDCLCQTTWFPPRRVPSQKAINDEMTHFGSIAGYAAKINYLGQNTLSMRIKKGNILNLRKTNVPYVPGVMSTPFCPLSEDDIDEYMYSIGLEDDPEAELEKDEPGRAPAMRLINSNFIDTDDLRWVRGSAWELFISTNVLTKDMAKLGRVYKKTKFKSPRDMLTHEDTYIYYLGVRRHKLELENYEEMVSTKVNRLFTYTTHNNDIFYDVEGNKHSKKEVLEDSSEMSQIFMKINAMWGSISIDAQTKEQFRAIRAHAVQHYPEDNPLIEVMERHKKVIEGPGEEEEKLTSSDAYQDFINSVIAIIADKSFIDAIKDVEFENPNIKRMETLMRYKPENFVVNRKIETLSDTRVRAELETISPGLCAKLFTKESMLTKRSKQNLLKMSKKSVTTERNRDLKKKKARMHLILSTMLGSILETNLKNSEDTGLYRDISDLLVEMDDEADDREFPSLLEIEPSRDDVEIVIDFKDFLERTFR